MKLAVFSDFDGTISKRDVGYSLFHHFSGGKNDALLPDWKSGKMSTRDCLLAEAAMVDAPADEILAFIDKIGIDDYFDEFAFICNRDNIPLTIVSDGLDFYIRHLLTKSGHDNLTFMANKSELVNNTVRITFDHENESCERCGICKGEVIQKFRNLQTEETKVIFIGDGYSDVCAAKEADILFAKKDLKIFCDEKKIDYFTYKTFDDIIIKLNEMQLITR
ncbi:MAG: hypothetical protein DWP97_06370 [Calditrichaeota bacterium]|nr:MAG: hypothetical protein DWP97_06370 [Calditrichota bacterium]